MTTLTGLSPRVLLVGLTPYEVLGNAMLFFLAGYDTTSTTLTYLMYNLARHPDCQQKAADEVDRVVGDQVQARANLLVLSTSCSGRIDVSPL